MTKKTLDLLCAPISSVSRLSLQVLQVSLGYRCNQRCNHCHVNAGPERAEVMERSTVEQVIQFLHSSSVRTLDLTGGAPELNPYFKQLVRVCRAMGVHVIDRCNLTILEEKGGDGLCEFLAEEGVEIIGSLPCYLRENVDSQRGPGAFDKSIRSLKRLNRLGYGKDGSGLKLNLVYNPLGAYLPPSQEMLEGQYRRELAERYGIEFNHLYTITNMPIHRFKDALISLGEYEAYRDLLLRSHRETNLPLLMCRTLISVDWQGFVYDCDFNQALGLPLQLGGRPKVHLKELKEEDLPGNPVPLYDHCHGCTAGWGSSCMGRLTE